MHSAAALRAPSHRTAGTCGVKSSARDARRRPRAWLRSVRSAGLARSGAGVTWTCRTASAGWAGRDGHTSVVDAAGAIYVIGGRNDGSTLYHDVWASTDRGRGVVGGVLKTVLKGVLRGTRRVLRGTTGYYSVLQGTTGGALG